MTPTRLLEAVAEETADAVKDYEMLAEEEADKPVTVYLQHIPDEDFEDDTYYPLVIVSLGKAEDDIKGSLATVNFTFGVYGEDKAAWKDLLSMMERVRQRLLTKRRLSRQFRLELPLVFETIERQPYPFWYGYASAKYWIGQPQEQHEPILDKIMEEDNRR